MSAWARVNFVLRLNQNFIQSSQVFEGSLQSDGCASYRLWRKIGYLCDKLFTLINSSYVPGSSLAEHATLFRKQYTSLKMSTKSIPNFIAVAESAYFSNQNKRFGKQPSSRSTSGFSNRGSTSGFSNRGSTSNRAPKSSEQNADVVSRQFAQMFDAQMKKFIAGNADMINENKEDDCDEDAEYEEDNYVDEPDDGCFAIFEEVNVVGKNRMFLIKLVNGLSIVFLVRITPPMKLAFEYNSPASLRKPPDTLPKAIGNHRKSDDEFEDPSHAKSSPSSSNVEARPINRRTPNPPVLSASSTTSKSTSKTKISTPRVENFQSVVPPSVSDPPDQLLLLHFDYPEYIFLTESVTLKEALENDKEVRKWEEAMAKEHHSLTSKNTGTFIAFEPSTTEPLIHYRICLTERYTALSLVLDHRNSGGAKK
ncbi:hypothetical protein H4Q26_015880 [Puccinia striiformis f. sp. tritici PST-130]|nr:hypothetical protein H4Q26_015880 [Puccinia striiformis f. sp. tritici PST-130]